tara:strand:- start:1154 stop:2008 length:855 start_codon:yes stop_codon:yes gene_type:complete
MPIIFIAIATNFTGKTPTMTKIIFKDNVPHVTIPRGFTLSNKFKLSKTRTIPVINLLQQGATNTKLAKNGTEYRTFGMSLAPHKLSGYNTCAGSTPECRAACLDGSGMRAVWESIHIGKIARTLLYFEHRQWFLNRLDREIDNKERNNNIKLAIRLNVVTDLNFISVINNHPLSSFYDYTKIAKRFKTIPDNYHLTFSYTGNTKNIANCRTLLKSGHNIAVVFAGPTRKLTILPKTFLGHPVINGDESDLRINDKPGSVVGLVLKADTTAHYNEYKQGKFVVTV